MNKRFGPAIAAIALLLCLPAAEANAQSGRQARKPAAQTLRLSVAEYEDRVHAIWIGQMAGAIIGFPFEHRTASVIWVDTLPARIKHAMVDDDWYYEMATIRAFEKYGVDMTPQQLGLQWKENSCGSWGSSEQARLAINNGIEPPMTGHPKYNKLWFTIGPQFSGDVYGALAPGMPNLAADLAVRYASINGYAEGLDGAIFVAGMISLGFVERDPKQIVRKAAELVNPKSPYRECLDLVIRMGEEGRSFREVVNAVEDRWHIEYPATNNAVPNGGIVAASVWYGEGDFLKTINLAFEAADFTDADCNAANAGAVIGAMKGLKGIPDHLIKGLNDRIKGEKMGPVVLTPAVDESISDLARRTAAIGRKLVEKHGAKVSGDLIHVQVETPRPASNETFSLSDLTRFWNPEWTLERAGFGGAGGGMRGIRGISYVEGDVLATYPRDEVRGTVLHRMLDVGNLRTFILEAGSDAGRSWQLNIYVNNDLVTDKIIEGGVDSCNWFSVRTDLSKYRGQRVKIRVYQRVLLPGREAGNAYWKNFRFE